MNEEREKVLRREHFSPIACAEKSARLFGEVRQRANTIKETSIRGGTAYFQKGIKMLCEKCKGPMGKWRYRKSGKKICALCVDSRELNDTRKSADFLIEVVRQENEYVLRLNFVPIAVLSETDIGLIAVYFMRLVIGAFDSIALPRGRKPIQKEEENVV